MRLEARKYLFDIERAAGLVAQFTAGREFADYEQEDMLRSAVERQFEVIGEALAQLSKLDSVLASRITGYRRIIAFRNILIHGYAEVDSRLVWGVIETSLIALRHEIAELTAEQ